MTVKERLATFLESRRGEIGEFAFVKPRDIPFSAEVRRACEANLCGRFGKCWTCPPGAGDWQSLRDAYCRYSDALLYASCHPLEDSLDWEGMEEGRRAHDALDEALLSALDGQELTLLGAGSCTLCERCTYPDAPCRQPHRARRSMEACGIDVVALSRSVGMRYMNGENTVTYFSVCFFNEETADEAVQKGEGLCNV